VAERSDAAQRTEEPTPKRLEEALRKGDAPRSQEITTAVMFLAALVVFAFLAGPAAKSLLRIGAAFLDRPHEFVVDGEALARLYGSLAFRIGAALGAIAFVFLAAAAAANAAQARLVLNFERLAPALSRLSPIEGFKRIYGSAALFNLLKGFFKIFIVGAILAKALWPDRGLLIGLVEAGEAGLLSAVSREILKLLALVALAMAAIAGLDYAFTRRSWKRRLRMTKEEVRRELKETEGDPVIRGRLRRERDMRARRRTLAAVRDATVLIMNPTHFAVALRYDPDRDAAPVCLAKGLDDLALRMRFTAEESRVPVVENPPLARALHAAAEVDAEIPVEHYAAVAEVIGFILRRDAQSGAPAS
jgi:flagellar biosynthetic protein FlhB